VIIDYVKYVRVKCGKADILTIKKNSRDKKVILERGHIQEKDDDWSSRPHTLFKKGNFTYVCVRVLTLPIFQCLRNNLTDEWLGCE
jgi:hypothetical protein